MKATLNRGFKAKAEKIAKEFRQVLSVGICEPLSANDLAKYLKISIYSASEFLSSPEEQKILSGSYDGDCGWSALTMVTESNNRIIIHNPFHSKPRQESNLMHELAHIICEHKQFEYEYEFTLPMGMRHYDDLQEEEAKCLGSTLQITREGLLWALKNKMKNEEIAEYFNASLEMVKYRINLTGVYHQLNARGKNLFQNRN